MDLSHIQSFPCHLSITKEDAQEPTDKPEKG